MILQCVFCQSETFYIHSFYGNFLSIKFKVWLKFYIINNTYSRGFLIRTDITKIFYMNDSLHHTLNCYGFLEIQV